MSDPRKKSLYFPKEMLAEMEAEAARLDIPRSRVLSDAWKLSKAFAKGEPWPEGVLLWTKLQVPATAATLDEPVQ